MNTASRHAHCPAWPPGLASKLPLLASGYHEAYRSCVAAGCSAGRIALVASGHSTGLECLVKPSGAQWIGGSIFGDAGVRILDARDLGPCLTRLLSGGMLLEARTETGSRSGSERVLLRLPT